MVLGCVQKAIAFVMLCSLSEAAEESAVKWASCFKLPELMHFGRFFSPKFLVFQGSFGLGRAATTSRLLQEFQYPYLFHLISSYGFLWPIWLSLSFC